MPSSPTARPPPARGRARGAEKRIKEQFVNNFGGDHTGEPIVMAGRYKLVELGWSPEKLRLKELPQLAISKIAAAIGVAPMSMGLEDPGKTYSNLAEANKTSWGTIIAVQELVAESLRWQLLPEAIATETGLASPPSDPYQWVIEYDYRTSRSCRRASTPSTRGRRGLEATS